jgi:hypothetical protein
MKHVYLCEQSFGPDHRFVVKVFASEPSREVVEKTVRPDGTDEYIAEMYGEEYLTLGPGTEGLDEDGRKFTRYDAPLRGHSPVFVTRFEVS